ncbi:MAG TPA: hypothetical protein VK576_05725 [Thermoleophilia bacterium]|nr:hypothetical protein [Thermoleophilia bacterium]
MESGAQWFDQWSADKEEARRSAAAPSWSPRVHDGSGGGGPAPRARRGERVCVCVDVIKPDRRDEWAAFVHDVLGPAGHLVDPDLMASIRFLEPSEANPDGSWTFLFIMDPYRDEAVYDDQHYLRRAYGDERARAYNELWEECHQVPQLVYEAEQSAW